MNSRMVQSIYDDRNPEIAPRWAYPDTGKWDAECKRGFFKLLSEITG